MYHYCVWFNATFPRSPPLFLFFFLQTCGILFLTCYIFIYISARFFSKREEDKTRRKEEEVDQNW